MKPVEAHSRNRRLLASRARGYASAVCFVCATPSVEPDRAALSLIARRRSSAASYGLADIVSDRFDAGVRLGEQVAKDMIAVRIAPDMPMSVVGAPSYLEQVTKPEAPQDLARHRGINLRLPTSGGLYVCGFKKGGHELKVRVEGPLVFNTIDLALDAALAGFGLAYLPSDQIQDEVENGRLIKLLEDWTPSLPGYHLYYPSRRYPAPAFALIVDALIVDALRH